MASTGAQISARAFLQSVAILVILILGTGIGLGGHMLAPDMELSTLLYILAGVYFGMALLTFALAAPCARAATAEFAARRRPTHQFKGPEIRGEETEPGHPCCHLPAGEKKTLAGARVALQIKTDSQNRREVDDNHG